MTTHSGMLRVSPLFSATVCFSAFLHDSVISTAVTAAKVNSLVFIFVFVSYWFYGAKIIKWKACGKSNLIFLVVIK